MLGLLSLRSTLLFPLGLFLIASASPLRAGEPGLPNPIRTELVFPGVTFGETGPSRFEMVFTISNRGSSPAAVLFDLFFPSGVAASLQFGNSERAYPVAWRTSVAPRSTLTLSFNRESRLVAPALFQGWGMLRSNQPVQVAAELRAFDDESREQTSELILLGQPRRLRETRFPLVSSPASTSPPAGFGGVQTGIALAIPGSRTARRLSLQLLALPDPWQPPDSAVEVAATTVPIPPNGQVSLLPTDLFPGLRGDFVRVSTDDVGGFAATVIAASTYQGKLHFFQPGLFAVGGDETYIYREGEPWGFDAGFRSPVIVGEARLTPSLFGVHLESPLAVEPRFFPFVAPEIHIYPDFGIAIAGDDRAKVVVFSDGSFIEEPLRDQQLTIRAVDGGLIEVDALFYVSVGLTAIFHKYVLIDPVSKTVLGRFVSPTDGPPPWRPLPG